ncbi:MAG: DUF2905 domain-containing protein [Anaerolineae bacterium]|nr:MAG: DUF2905 domain-containing protein [Anaerolineae bacterium]
MNLESIGRILLLLGLSLTALGALFLLLARFDISLGRLPGDFRFQSGNFTCVFPLASSLLISLLLTVLLNLLARFLQR